MIDLDELREQLPAYLGRQRWFAGAEPEKVAIEDDEEFGDRLHWVLAEADGARYQVFVGHADAADVPEFLHGHDAAIIGASQGRLLYDALLDGELSTALLARIAPDESVHHVRPMGAEQSNTSLVFDDRIVLKVFRRVHEGSNPDIEVTAKLGDVRFEHVAVPTAVWTRDERDLAVVQPYLAGATDGWALALTSLRDLYANDCDDPAECGGDFAAEARRLGEVTASMHLAMAEAFGVEADSPLSVPSTTAPWSSPTGPALRVHGDYHLGQVVRTDAGWIVLDFEGEPARPLRERVLPSSPLKDVGGMLRSFDYAQAVALRDRGEEDVERCLPLGKAWEQRNRDTFVAGYLGTAGIEALLPSDVDAVLAAWELDKAVYEVQYERSHRPDWVDIPEAAVARILSR